MAQVEMNGHDFERVWDDLKARLEQARIRREPISTPAGREVNFIEEVNDRGVMRMSSGSRSGKPSLMRRKVFEDSWRELIETGRSGPIGFQFLPALFEKTFDDVIFIDSSAGTIAWTSFDGGATVDEDELRRRAKSLSISQRPSGNLIPERVERTVVAYRRLPSVVAWVLARADGRCEVCNENAPFVDDDGAPFLEVHHLVMLANGGPDTAENAVAACPNCHRRLHHGTGRQELTAQVRKVLARKGR